MHQKPLTKNLMDRSIIHGSTTLAYCSTQRHKVDCLNDKTQIMVSSQYWATMLVLVPIKRWSLQYVILTLVLSTKPIFHSAGCNRSQALGKRVWGLWVLFRITCKNVGRSNEIVCSCHWSHDTRKNVINCAYFNKLSDFEAQSHQLQVLLRVMT